MPAIIFDCDGVLADTERDGHLPAFNQTFREFGLPVQWSSSDYASKLQIGGGKERMTSLLTPDFIRAAGLPDDPDILRKSVEDWHRRKTEIYTTAMRGGSIPGRPGIARLVQEARDARWELAVASTSAQRSVEATLEHVVGPAAAAGFTAVLAGDIVAKKKPAPDIYDLAADRLASSRREIVVIEDSRNGLLAAVGANLACLITVSTYTALEDFHEAALVVSSLGDPDGERTRVLANQTGREPQEWVVLADLRACMEAGPRLKSSPGGMTGATGRALVPGWTAGGTDGAGTNGDARP
jgi:HAD superfamily hydrolase (TIGR01509 family)